MRGAVTISGNKSGNRGRPRGLGPRITCLVHAAYAKDLNQVYILWKRHFAHLAASVDMLTDSYARALGWQKDHLNYNMLIELAIRTISRELLSIKILNQDFTRVVHDPQTGKVVRNRPADQFARLEELDDDIQKRIAALGLLPKPHSRQRKPGGDT